MKTHQRLLEHLDGYPKEIWEQLEEFRKEKGKNGSPDWEDWCYCPLAATIAITTQLCYGNVYNGVATAPIVAAFGAWRMTKSIYSFAPELFKELWETPIEGLPVEILYNLPEWCVYIELQDIEFLTEEIKGFFCYLEYDVNNGDKEVRFVLDAGDGRYLSLALPLRKGTIRENLDELYNPIFADLNYSPTPEAKEQTVELITSLVSLVLYLCSDDRDLNNTSKNREVPANPKTLTVRTKNKNKKKTIPLALAKWEVGYRVVESIKKNNADYENYKKTETGEGTRKRPHYRRAHWHSYWKGQRDSADRRIIVKWISPVFVNAESEEDVIPTYKKVIKFEDKKGEKDDNRE